MKIDDLNKRNIYKVPDEYFEKLPGKIQKKIQAENKANTFEWTFWLKIASPVAAALLILALFIFRTPDIQEDQITSAEILSEISSDELISFLELTDVSSEAILSELKAETIEELEIVDDEFIMDEDMSEEELDALIEEYNIDV